MRGERPTLQTLGNAYRMTRQAMLNLQKRLGMTRTELSNPELVFEHLLEHIRSSPLRSRLSNPQERIRISKTLNS